MPVSGLDLLEGKVSKTSKLAPNSNLEPFDIEVPKGVNPEYLASSLTQSKSGLDLLNVEEPKSKVTSPVKTEPINVNAYNPTKIFEGIITKAQEEEKRPKPATRRVLVKATTKDKFFDSLIPKPRQGPTRNIPEGYVDIKMPEQFISKEDEDSFVTKLIDNVSRLFTSKAEEKAKAAYQTISADYLGVNPSDISPDLVSAFRSGYGGTPFGLISQIERGTKYPKPIKEEMNTKQQLAAGLGGVIGSLPTFIPFSLAGIEGGPVGMMMAGFAGDQGLRAYYSYKLENGEVSSPKEFVDSLKKVIPETFKGAALGTATGVAGKVAAPLGTIAKVGAEAGVMTTMSAALEGTLPTPQDFINNAILFGSIHGISKVPTALKNIKDVWVKTGRAPKDIVEDTNTDSTLAKALVSEESISEDVIAKAQAKVDAVEKAQTELAAKLEAIKNPVEADALVKEELNIKGKKVRDIKKGKIEEEIELPPFDSDKEMLKSLGYEEVEIAKMSPEEIQKILREDEFVESINELKPIAKSVESGIELLNKAIDEVPIEEKKTWNETMTSRLETVNQEIAQNREKIIAQSKKQAEYDGWSEKWTPEKAIDNYYKEHSGIATSGWKALKKGETWKGRLEKLAEREKKTKEQPITDVDLQTGAPLPKALEPANHPFRDKDAKHTEMMKKLLQEKVNNIDATPEVFTRHLINEVNRWLNGEEVAIDKVRDGLSELAVRADSLKNKFGLDKDFTQWRDTVKEAARWARESDRLINKQTDFKLTTGIDPTQIKKLYDDLISKIASTKNISMRKGEMKRRGQEIVHGTDIDNLPNILKDGLKADSAVDTTGDWIGEYPVAVTLSNPKLGEYVEHNKYYKLKDKASITKVVVDLDQYEYSASNKIKNQVADLAKQYPSIKFIILDNSEGVRKPKYTLDDMVDLDNKIIELYKAPTPEIDALKAEKAKILEPFKRGEYSYNTTGMKKELRDRLDEINDEVKLLEKQRQREINLLENKARQAAIDVDEVEGTDFGEDIAVKNVEEFESNYVFNIGPKLVGNKLKEGSWYTIGSKNALYARDDFDTSKDLYVYAVRKDRIKNIPAESNDLVGAGMQEEGKYLRSKEALIPDFSIRLNEENLLKGDLFKDLRENTGIKLYTGIDPTQIPEATKKIIAGAKALASYTAKARGLKEFKPSQAFTMAKEEFIRSGVDRSGNIRRELLDKLGNEGYEIIQKMYLSKGASSLAAQNLKQMRKEVYDGLSKDDKRILDNLILADRMLDIGKYKTASQFKFPEGLSPVESAAYNELFQFIEKITPERADILKQRSKAYFEWMKKPLKDMLDEGLISQEEYNNLVSHNYRRLKLVDVFDKRYQTRLGKTKRTVYDSGVEALSHGRETDVFEPSSEVMALEVFNRAYGRILNNAANKTLLDLARTQKDNPFVAVKENPSDHIPSGWDRIFVYENGERKALYLSPTMAKEWITNNPEMSYKMSQIIRYASGSPILRMFATGIDWGFALANLPRDIMHIWYASRVFEDGKWKSLYNSNLPIYSGQISADIGGVFNDAILRKGRYQDYIKEGGGMEFLVHQGRLMQRGRHIGSEFDKIQDFLGYFGETSEILTRLAVRDRVIKRGASEKGISYEEAYKDSKIRQEATFAARDYMDFGQGGGVAKAADNGLPYLNAAIQGTRGLFRSFKDNPIESSYKLAQFAALTTGLYIANQAINPETMKNLKGSVAMQGNLCIPLGDGFGFDDEKGQRHYPYLKIPLDPGQKFFKMLFEASYDKATGQQVDAAGVANSLSQISPVAISSLPPTLSGALGYTYNKDFWLNDEIWKKTDKPLGWPYSKEEYIPGKTPQALIDIGAVSGLSPERLKYTMSELVTGGSMWSWLAGQGYDAAFGSLPKEKKEMHLAEVLSKTPIVKRFIGITNPYSQFAEPINEAKEQSMVKRWIENRGLDQRVESYLYEGGKRSDVIDYINQTAKDLNTRDRLKDRFIFSEKIKNLPNRSFWLSLKGITDTEARAKVFVDRFDSASLSEKEQLNKEIGIVTSAGGIISDEFKQQVTKIRNAKSKTKEFE